MRRLRNKCEQVKRKLSESPDDSNWQYELELDDFLDGIDFTIPIQRCKFEELNHDAFIKAIALVPACLKSANLSIADINDIVPLGGSMRIPKLRDMLQCLFQGRQLYGYINPDEAIAVGASVLAAQMLGLYCGHIMLSDFTPYSLGIRVDSGFLFHTKKNIMSVIIPRNTKIPCQKSFCYYTSVDKQTVLPIDVYQGENEYVKDNTFLGRFTIKNLTPASAGKIKVEITLAVNVIGLLTVTGKEVTKRKENLVSVVLDTLIPHLNILKVNNEK